MADTSTNLSKIQRERLLDICSRIKNKEAVEVTEIAELEQFIKSMKYGLIFESHEESVDAMLRTHIPVFKGFKEIINNPDSADCNFLLEGDNLHSLKLLEKTHKGAIDVIYIDPPYNTLNDDFTYGDKMLDENDGFIHSKWLSFMKERLEIARKLLSKNGAIFISIDDSEQAQLKMLCDSIFGCEKYVTTVPRLTKSQRSGQEKFMDISHDYMLIYANCEDFKHIVDRDVDPTKIKRDKNGCYIQGDTKAILAAKGQGYSSGGDYDFEYNGKIYQPVDKNGNRNRWLWSKQRMEAAAKLGILVETGNTLRSQMYLDVRFDEKTNTMVPKNDKMIFHTSQFMLDNKYSNSAGDSCAQKVLGERKFSNPKPLSLIKDVIKLQGNPNAIVLDFFAGSGTTGHAVLELNEEDGGNRKFILCTNNEIVASETLKYLQNNGYMQDVKPTGKNKSIQSKIDGFLESNPSVYQTLFVEQKEEYETYGICQAVTYQRIKITITGIRSDGSKYSDGIKTNLKYFQTDMIDKTDDDLDELLYEASFYLAELENMAMIDGISIRIANCDEDIDDIITNATERLKEVFIADDVLLSSQQKDFFMRHNVEVKQIPNYYYKEM